MLFSELNLNPSLLRGIQELGFERPTPVQEQAIPHIIEGRDVIASAQTGTGKTAAFVLPILHNLLSKETEGKTAVRALIIAPTRELALQSMEHLQKLSRYVNLRGEAIFGGVSMEPQIRALNQGVDVISATPGRLLDHVYQGRIDFGALEVLVLDEADRMMDMGFLPDVKRIISLLPPQRQNLIFSATIPDEIMKLSQAICKDPVTVQVGPKTNTAAGIRHAIYPVGQEQKTELLLRLLKGEGMVESSVIIFTRTKSRADRLTQSLERAGIRTSVIHGDRSQGQRLNALERFKGGRTQVLVATDIAARGIDVKDISHVINYDVPHTPEDYIHRSGRTARAESTGDAFTLVSPDEEEAIGEVERVINQKVPRVTLPDFDYRKGGHSPQRRNERGSPRQGRPQQGGRPQDGRRHEGRPSSHSQSRPHTPASPILPHPVAEAAPEIPEIAVPSETPIVPSEHKQEGQRPAAHSHGHRPQSSRNPRRGGDRSSRPAGQQQPSKPSDGQPRGGRHPQRPERADRQDRPARQEKPDGESRPKPDMDELRSGGGNVTRLGDGPTMFFGSDRRPRRRSR